VTRPEPDGPDLYRQFGRPSRSVLPAHQVGSRETASVETVDEEDALLLLGVLEP
jgi:hypothetical protein